MNDVFVTILMCWSFIHSIELWFEWMFKLMSKHAELTLLYITTILFSKLAIWFIFLANHSVLVLFCLLFHYYTHTYIYIYIYINTWFAHSHTNRGVVPTKPNRCWGTSLLVIDVIIIIIIMYSAHYLCVYVYVYV